MDSSPPPCPANSFINYAYGADVSASTTTSTLPPVIYYAYVVPHLNLSVITFREEDRYWAKLVTEKLNIFPNPTEGIMKIGTSGTNPLEKTLVDAYNVYGNKYFPGNFMVHAPTSYPLGHIRMEAIISM